MSDLETSKIDEGFEKIINCIKDINARDGNNQKKSLFNIEMLIKLAVPLIMGVMAYAGMSYKIDNSSENIVEIKQSLKESSVQRDVMILQIQTCQTQIAVLNEQVKDLQNNQNDKK